MSSDVKFYRPVVWHIISDLYHSYDKVVLFRI